VCAAPDVCCVLAGLSGVWVCAEGG
jgi:hypothetical protein